MRIVHYINQFFGGIGGEDKADYRPEVREGVVGPGMALKGALGGAGEIVATVICGDSWFNENLEEAKETVLGLIKQYNPDLVVAGPAFNAGRYGMATIGAQLVNMRDGGFISAHDYKLGMMIAEIVSGGDIEPNSLVSEQWLLDLERKAFMELLGNPKTQERIMGMMQTGKPVRN